MLGLLMVTMHPFLGGTAEVERLHAVLEHASGCRPIEVRRPSLRP
jgi:hypothetical protein